MEMDVKRYTVVQAILTKEKELIPIWDERIVFEKTELYGNVITIKGDHRNHYRITECIYDIKTRTLSGGIDVDIYPDITNTKFKKGEQVYFKDMSDDLVPVIIEDIVFTDYVLNIKKGKKLEQYQKKHIKDLEPESLYALKEWNYAYLLNTGQKIEHSFYLYRIKK